MASAPEAESGVALIDTHAHLDDYARRGELAGVLAEARAAGVGEVIAIGTESGDWPVGREMAEGHPGVVHYTVGLHPCSVQADWAGEVAKLAAYWAGSSRPVALGECGLDRFHLPRNDPAAAAAIFTHQRGAFAAQLTTPASL